MDTVTLRIGEQETVFIVRRSREPVAVLPIGTARPGGRAFRSSPPSALDLEEAIEGIEDAVMPLARKLPPGAALATDDALAARIPGAGEDTLSGEAVERAFNLLADVAQGRPAAHGGAVVEPHLAAYVLVLREVMPPPWVRGRGARRRGSAGAGLRGFQPGCSSRYSAGAGA